MAQLPLNVDKAASTLMTCWEFWVDSSVGLTGEDQKSESIKVYFADFEITSRYLILPHNSAEWNLVREKTLIKQYISVLSTLSYQSFEWIKVGDGIFWAE